jgi:hypothetical protein
MDKSIVIITAHCDDDKKINMLVDCINEINSQGYPIIVSSHIKVPDFIYDMVDYVIYDKENPIIYNHEFGEYGPSTTWLWTSYSGFYQEYTLDFNHAYAVLKLIKNSVSVARVNGYDISHVVCYDYIIRDKNLLNNHTEKLKEEYDVYSYRFEGVAIEGVSAGLFSFKNDIFLQSFSNVNSKKDYSNCNYAIFEQFLEMKFLSNSAKIFKRSIDEIRNENIIDKVTNIGNLSKNIISKDSKNIALLFLTKVNSDNYIYFISFHDELLTLNLTISGNEYRIKPNTYKSNLIPISYEQLSSGIKLEIPEVEILEFYNLESRYSNGRIDDNNIIVKLEDIKSH